MPNLYNRPRWTLGYLISVIRHRSTVPALLFLAAFCLLVLGGVRLPPEALHSGGLRAANQVPWRLRGLTLLVGPMIRALESTHLLLFRGGPGGAPEAGALVVLAASAGLAGVLTQHFLVAIGFGTGMVIQVGILLVFGTTLAGASWQYGPEALLAASLAGVLRFAWEFRLEGRNRDAAFGLGFLLLGCLLDQRFALILPILAATCLPPAYRRRERPLTLACLVLAVGVLWFHQGTLLTAAEQSFVSAYLSPGPVLRRLVAALLGAGSSLFVAAPPALLAALGARRLWRYDSRLALASLGCAGVLCLARLVLVHDLDEASVSLVGFAPLLPALAPAMAFGILRLKEKRVGVAVLLGVALVGVGFQVERFLFDPGDLRPDLSRGGMDFPLDRSFTPELSDPVLGIHCLRTYLSGAREAEVWMPKVRGVDATGRGPLLVDASRLEPRPWPWRLARWRPGPGEDPGARLGGRVWLGPRHFWLELLGGVVSFLLGFLGLLALLSLLERLAAVGQSSRPGGRGILP